MTSARNPQLLLEDYPTNLDPAVRWTRPPSPWLTKEAWLDSRRRKSPFGSSADDEPFRQFLSERGVTEEMMARFGVEWSPDYGLVASLDAETGAKFAAGFAYVKLDRKRSPGLEDLIMDSGQDGPRLWRVALGEAIELGAGDPDGEVYLHWLLDESIYQAERFYAGTGTVRGPHYVTTYSESIHGLAEYFTRPCRGHESKVMDDDVLKLKLADGSLVPLVQPIPYAELNMGGLLAQEDGDYLPGETDPNKVVVVGSSSPLPGAGGAAAAEADDDDDLMWVT